MNGVFLEIVKRSDGGRSLITDERVNIHTLVCCICDYRGIFAMSSLDKQVLYLSLLGYCEIARKIESGSRQTNSDEQDMRITPP